MPSADESFWVDELHSAWTVWDGWSDVAPRAHAGNQLPLYFWGLWLWKALVGSSEVALRLSSIAALALSCLVLCFWASGVRGAFGPGLIAAALLAVERHAIFYGTELRSYAAVILCSSVAAVALWRMLTSRGPLPRLALAAAVAAAALLQPATLAPFLILPAACYVVHRHRGALRARDLGIAYAAVAAALLLSAGMLQRLWQARGQWHSFAVPDGLLDLYSIWAWFPLVILPLGALWAARWGARRCAAGGTASADSVPGARILRFAYANLLAVIASVLLVWLCAASGLLPLWHRRYLVGCLPMLCIASGGIWFHVSLQVCRTPRVEPFSGHVRAVLLLSAALLVVRLQGAPVGEIPVVHRGENWRGAVRLVQERRRAEEPVFLAAQLIESRTLDSEDAAQPTDEQQIAYLRYPLSGPYRVPDVRPVGSSMEAWREALRSNLHRNPSAVAGRNGRSVAWLIARVPKTRAEAFSGLLEQYNEDIEVVVHPFGSVAVIRASAR